MDLGKYEPYLFLVIGLMWLLPLLGVGTGAWGSWVATLAVILIGAFRLMPK